MSRRGFVTGMGLAIAAAAIAACGRKAAPQRPKPANEAKPDESKKKG